ncbi:MAG: hypothetical protein AAB662_04750 [Patescibacteria group bacterium]
MTEIRENTIQTERQDHQSLLKDLFNAVREKSLPLDEKNAPIYKGELINGILTTGIIIGKLHARWSGGFMAQGGGYVFPRAEILLPKEKSPYKEFYNIYIEEFGVDLYAWKLRKKGLIPKYTYDFSFEGEGQKYQRFLNENHGNHLDLSSTEDVRRLTNNIRNWKKV